MELTNEGSAGRIVLRRKSPKADGAKLPQLVALWIALSDTSTVAQGVPQPGDGHRQFPGLACLLLPLTSGLRAANSHNAQAWRRRQTPDGMAIPPDLSRALPVADSGLHHLFASLEAAARVEGAEVLLVTDPGRVAQVLEPILTANTAQGSDPAFAAELKSWLRFQRPGSNRDRRRAAFGCVRQPHPADVPWPLHVRPVLCRGGGE